MYLEHFQLHTSPFREEVDPAVFFPQAGRETILQGLQKDLEIGRLLIKIVGLEGTGKTLLCNVLFERLPDSYEVVYLDNPVGSFDDLLRIINLDLGMEPAGAEVDLVKELKKQLQRRQKHGQKVVLVLDGAEKIFLATLERLLRLLCELEGFSETFSLILSGRPGLEANLEQLTVYCTGVDIHNTGYFLETMTPEETGRYLSFRLLAAGLSADKQQEVFTGEAVEKIFATANGNPRLTNILAEEALQKSCSEKSFMVLLDHVGDEGQPIWTGRKKEDLLQVVEGNKRLLAVGAGITVLVLLLVFLLSGEDEPSEVTVMPDSLPTASSGPAVGHEVEKTETEDDLPAAPEKAVESSPPKQDATASSDAADKPTASLADQDVTGKDVESQADEAGERDGSKLFQERLRASAGWLAGAYRNEYTIQLMMLTSDQAADNVEKLLVQDEYFNIKDKLHILRKKTNPPTLFVFYGTFDSMDTARQARNKMPIFLRKHHPYALSIADALTKTED